MEIGPIKDHLSLTIDLAIELPGIFPKELNIYVHTNSHTRMLLAALFLITKTWKQPRCPSVGEWINKLWSIQTMEYYSALKRNELLSQEETWRKLKCISLSEISQSEKATYFMSLAICHFGKGKTVVTVKRSVVVSCWGGGERGMNGWTTEEF